MDVGSVLILAPTGRDAAGAAELLGRAGARCEICPDPATLNARITVEGVGAIGTVVVAEEALTHPAHRRTLSALLAEQPPWSDLPFIVLSFATAHARLRLRDLSLSEALGNVMFLERPLHALTLVSAVQSALRARRRQHLIEEHIAARETVGAQLHALNADLERRVRVAVAESERAQSALAQAQKIEAVGQLTGGIAHDFNNLLQALNGSLELIAKRSAGQERIEKLAAAGMEVVGRAAKLTKQLLAFSRIQRIELHPVEVDALLLGMVDLLDRSIGAAVTVRFDLAAGDACAVADANQVELAVLNLVINARDAMSDGGTVVVRTRLLDEGSNQDILAGPYLEIAVADDGTGMPPDVLARAFDPFFTTKAMGHGTGLGLSQVYGIARQCGGAARIDSAEGRGTTVRLLLPLALEPAAAQASHVDPVPSWTGAHAERRRTVLVIDDDHDVRRALTASLDELGYRVIEAASGPAGIELLHAHRPDLLLVDYAMPGMNGAEVARAAQTIRGDLPIVFASGYADSAALVEAVGSRAHMLRKPFSLADLATTMASAMRASAARVDADA